jgi:MFS family permease
MDGSLTDRDAGGLFLTRAFVVLGVFYFLVYTLGYQMLPVVPLHLRNIGASLAESGRFASAFTIGSAAGALFTGSLGDRLGQRKVLIGASLLSMGFFVAYAFMKVRWGLYLLAPLHGLVWSALRTSTMAKAGSLLTEENRAQGMSIFGLAAPAGVAAGPILGLALWPLMGFHWFMILLGASFFALFLLIQAVPGEPESHRRQGPLIQQPDAVVIMPACILLLLGISFGPIPPFAAQEAKFLHMSWPAASLTCIAIGMVGLRFILGVRGMGRDPVQILPATLSMTCIGMLMMALLPGGTWRHAAGGLIYGAGYGISHTLMFMIIIESCLPKRRGAGVGLLFCAYDVGQSAGAYVIGLAMESAGARWSQAVGYRLGWGIGAISLLVTVGLSMHMVGARRSRARNGEG